MIDATLTLLLREAWLLACLGVFLAVLWHLTRPGAREASARHAAIPFQEEDDDGRA